MENLKLLRAKLPLFLLPFNLIDENPVMLFQMFIPVTTTEN